MVYCIKRLPDIRIGSNTIFIIVETSNSVIQKARQHFSSRLALSKSVLIVIKK